MRHDLEQSIQLERQALLSHPLFASILTLDDVRLLMETHVYAVWDFMTLLKRIQRELTCVELPWTPPRHRDAARLINEIVVGEESDEMPDGGFASHLTLYLNAMDEIDADASVFRSFLEWVVRGMPPSLALELVPVPDAARVFVAGTLKTAQDGSLEEVLAHFLFAREDVIPAMFSRLLKSWAVPESSAPMFCHYLKRHIELDNEKHTPAARRLIAEVIGTCEQEELLARSARAAIRARIALWDGVQVQLCERSRMAAAHL